MACMGPSIRADPVARIAVTDEELDGDQPVREKLITKEWCVVDGRVLGGR